MTVSIVIPCYNQVRFVGEAIASAVTQSAPPAEVVVVDDGSTDGSADIISVAAATHANVRVVTQTNQGLSAARNAGLGVATGEVVIFLDADDRLLPDAAHAACIALADHPSAAMTFGRCTLIDESGHPMPTNLPVVGDRFYAELLRRNYIWTPAMAAFRRAALSTLGGFDSRVDRSADYDMYLRAARSFPIAAHPVVVAEYRQHGASMSKNPVAMLDATLAVLRAQRRHIAGDRQLTAAYRDGIAGWRGFYGEQLVERFRAALHAGRYRDALRAAGHLLRLYPKGVLYHLAKKARLIMRDARLRPRKSPPPSPALPTHPAADGGTE